MNKRGRPPHPDVLTPREWEVLALLREELTDQAIADRLGISLDGAKYHVREILSKLSVGSRHEAAAWQPEAPTPAPRWAMLPLAVRIAGVLVVVGAVAVLGVLAAGLALDSEEAATAGDHSAEEAAALMLAGRELRGVIATASAERTTLSAARDNLAQEWSTGIGDGQAATTSDGAGDPELWLVRLTGEFDVLVYPEGLRQLVPVEMPIGPRDPIERQCTRAAAYVTDDFLVQPFAGPELTAGECLASGQASREAATAAAGQASYEILGPRAVLDASAELTDGATVWQVAVSDLLFESGSPSSPLECRQLVVRSDAVSLQVLNTSMSSANNCSDPPVYSMAREDVQSIAEDKADAEIYLGTIEQVEVERIRMADARTYYFPSGYGGVHNFVEDLPAAAPRAPAWRVAMRGAILLDTNPVDLSHDIGACRELTVYVDDAAGEPIYMSYEVLEPGDCDQPIPTYPPAQQQ
jgi:DNA-binding CsgD family transcriptional regulator